MGLRRSSGAQPLNKTRAGSLGPHGHHVALCCHLPVQVVARGNPWWPGSYRSAEVMAEYVVSTVVLGMSVLFHCWEWLFTTPPTVGSYAPFGVNHCMGEVVCHVHSLPRKHGGGAFKEHTLGEYLRVRQTGLSSRVIVANPWQLLYARLKLYLDLVVKVPLIHLVGHGVKGTS